MAKLTAPLMSFEARGALARAISFNQTGARSTAKQWHKPTGTPSGFQDARRTAYRDGSTVWATLTPAEKASYNAAALPLRMSGYNLFMRDYMNANAPTVQTKWDNGATIWDAGQTLWLE